MKIPDKRSTIFCRKGYTVEQVVDDIHTWYDPFCSLSWYGNENLRLITEIEEVQSLGISVHFPVTSKS